jgi:hypothetical protein
METVWFYSGNIAKDASGKDFKRTIGATDEAMVLDYDKKFERVKAAKEVVKIVKPKIENVVKTKKDDEPKVVSSKKKPKKDKVK